MKAKHMSLSKAFKEESIAQFSQRVRSGGARKPLRSIRELADEFGVPHKTLRAKLSLCKDAPKPRYSTGSSKTASQRNTWYDPDEVRAWWRGLNQKEKACDVKSVASATRLSATTVLATALNY